MNQPSHSTMRTKVALGALLLLAITSMGCGVGMPTQPDLDQAAGIPATSVAAAENDSRGPVELDDPGMPGGTETQEIPPATDVEVESGPGNSDWGHSHKKPKLGD